MIQLLFNNKSIIPISDTHGKHRELNIPSCDILIHCGDVCTDGNEKQMNDFFEWFSATPAIHKIFVSGNHDYPFVFEPDQAVDLIPSNIAFLENRVKTIGGIRFYGIRSQENLFTIPEIQNEQIDFLLTHVPPKSILDNGIGCSHLLSFVKKQQPQYHIFGHMHAQGSKTMKKENTVFINVCSFTNV